MTLSYEARSEKAAKRALRMLDVESVYNHLYFISTEYSRDRYEAEDRLRAVWALLYGSLRIGLVTDDQSSRLNELRALTREYLEAPASHSLWLRNLLIGQMFDAAYPVPKGINIPDKAVLPTLLLVLVLFWALPDLADLVQNVFRVVIVGFVIWLLITYGRRRLIDHLRQELRSGQFNDEIVRTQLEKLDARHHRLPTLIFNLIDQKPATFSKFEIEHYRASIPPEQWQEGMRIKSNWQKELYNQFTPAKQS